MFRILILLIIGTAVGYLTRRNRLVRRTGHLAQPIVCALLFSFGASLGSDRQMVERFADFGGQALLLALLGIAGSLTAAAIAERYLFRKGGGR